jgi:CDP-glycerol glycerophosphotransferase (TagB/SpsB family)
MVRSWDNTTTKGILRIIPEKIIVNSPLMKEELIKFHDCQSENVFVAGLPQFDSWLAGPKMAREKFFKQVGANPTKRLILFAPAGAILSDTDWQICQILKEAIQNGQLPSNIQFLVRNHPHHPADLSKFNDDPSFIIENPGEKSGVKNDRTGADLSPDDNAHLMHSIYFSDLVMYIATSLSLDATVFDKPQIVISFDGWERRPYIRSVRRYHEEDNMRSLIALGGTKVAKSKEELITAINQYLKNPGLDRDGRQKIVKRQMYKIDGLAGRRIGEFVWNFLKSKLD